MNFLNFFKNSVVLNCYTHRPEVFKYSPIRAASNFFPDWWKQLPKTYANENIIHPVPTMKYCVGLIDLFKHGFIMPMWSDAIVEIGKQGTSDYQYQFADGCSHIVKHSANQRGTVYPELDFEHLKIESPWIFTCDEPIDFLMADTVWNKNDPSVMSVLPGVLNFKYQCGTNINTLWKRNQETIKHTMEFSTPLCHFIPLTDKKIILKVHLVSREKHVEISSVSHRTKFVGKYKANKRLLKESGCPFHHAVEK